MKVNNPDLSTSKIGFEVSVYFLCPRSFEWKKFTFLFSNSVSALARAKFYSSKSLNCFYTKPHFCVKKTYATSIVKTILRPSILNADRSDHVENGDWRLNYFYRPDAGS